MITKFQVAYKNLRRKKTRSLLTMIGIALSSWVLVSLLGFNQGYEASLEKRKLYESVPDKEAERHDQVRIIDESGEDYLFPSKLFAPVRLPMQTRNKILERVA